MSRMAWLMFVAGIISITAVSSLAGELWGPPALDAPSAGVVGKAFSDLPAEFNVMGSVPSGQKGIFVGEVVEGGFIHAAGGKKFDIILALNGWRVDSISELYVASRNLKPGNVATALILRSRVTTDAVYYERKPIEVTAVVPTRREAILARLVQYEDRATGETLVRHIRATADRNSETQLSAAFQIKKGKATNLRVVISVVGKKLTVPSAIEIAAGDKTRSFPVKASEVGTHIGLSTSSAWVDWPVNRELLALLSTIAQQGQGTLRFELRDANPIDVNLGRDMAFRISDLLVGYKMYGGDVSDEQLAWFRNQIELGDRQLETMTVGVKLKKYYDVPNPDLSFKPLTSQ